MFGNSQKTDGNPTGMTSNLEEVKDEEVQDVIKKEINDFDSKNAMLQQYMVNSAEKCLSNFNSGNSFMKKSTLPQQIMNETSH